MANEIKYPEGKYKVVSVGPVEKFSFKGDDGNDVPLVSYALQLEGVAEWVKLTQKPDAAAPIANEELEGHVEDTGKYGYKFVKKRTGGGGWGGRRDSTGAHFNAAMSMASDVVIGYYNLTKTKPESIGEILTRIEELTPKFKAMVDKFAGAEKQAEPAPADKPAEKPAETDGPVISDIKETELNW